jgi:nitrate/nitrite transporter NarK
MTAAVSGCHDMKSGVLTLVLRVRLTTLPALMMRSNSKQPFWLTGDMTPMLAVGTLAASKRGCAMPNVSSLMPEERAGTAMGVTGVCSWAPSAMVAMVACACAVVCSGRGVRSAVAVAGPADVVSMYIGVCAINGCYGRSPGAAAAGERCMGPRASRPAGRLQQHVADAQSHRQRKKEPLQRDAAEDCWVVSTGAEA